MSKQFNLFGYESNQSNPQVPSVQTNASTPSQGIKCPKCGGSYVSKSTKRQGMMYCQTCQEDGDFYYFPLIEIIHDCEKELEKSGRNTGYAKTGDSWICSCG